MVKLGLAVKSVGLQGPRSDFLFRFGDVSEVRPRAGLQFRTRVCTNSLSNAGQVVYFLGFHGINLVDL